MICQLASNKGCPKSSMLDYPPIISKYLSEKILNAKLNFNHTVLPVCENLAMTTDAFAPVMQCDVLVVGGGINGTGIARDLAGRGLAVVLCEKDDLAQHTSSCSTKLIHGGLRYLEHYEFSLVRKALQEREVLLKSAPHIMWPLRFVMPHDPAMRPAWMIRAGIFLYDHLARRNVLPGSETIALRRHEAGRALKPEFTTAFAYSDGWVDDARLVVLNAMDARRLGATVLTHTKCISAQRAEEAWQATLQSDEGITYSIHTRALVNAAGPWAEQFLREHAKQKKVKSLRLIKGSHIVVKKIFEHPMAYIFQGADKRIVFAIPYEQDFTLIGTTDVELDSAPDDVRIDTQETEYLCQQVSRYFAKPVTAADVVWSYSGVRPLLDDAEDDPAAVTRDYRLELDLQGAPLLSAWGGKLTTYRKLAEEAADLLCQALGSAKPGWTAKAFLPGGNLSNYIGAAVRPDLDFERFEKELAHIYSWLPNALRHRMARCHGTLISEVLGDAKCLADLGKEIVPGLHEAELHYFCQSEWARTAADILWRRTKLGLHSNAEDYGKLEKWLQERKGVKGVTD